MSTTISAARAHPDKYESDFDAVVAFFSHYIDKDRLTPSVKDVSIGQTRSIKRQETRPTQGTLKVKIKLKKYFMKEYDLKSIMH